MDTHPENSKTGISDDFCSTGRNFRFAELQIKASEEAPAEILAF